MSLTPAELRDLADSFMLTTDIVKPGEEQDLRDAADQPVLATLLAGSVDYFITGDKDLLALAGRDATVTPAQLWERHGA